jgi:hypothetical protein
MTQKWQEGFVSVCNERGFMGKARMSREPGCRLREECVDWSEERTIPTHSQINNPKLFGEITMGTNSKSLFGIPLLL